MKVKTISRNPADYVRQTKSAPQPEHRNLDPTLHPLAAAHEYTRALNAAKLERMHAKPFLAALSGHTDGVYCMATREGDVNTVVSGSGDGEVRVWRLSNQSCSMRMEGAHQGAVSGVGVFGRIQRAVSAGVDKTIKIWDLAQSGSGAGSAAVTTDVSSPLDVMTGTSTFGAIDTHQEQPLFATASGTGTVQVWDLERADPVNTFSWGADTVNTVRFNRVQVNVLASSGTDRAVVLYDLRTRTPLARVVTQLRMNALAWNPMEAYVFTGANEDHNCYTFDMRKLDHAVNILKDHVSAVLDLDYSPTGDELVTGAYDRTLRIFNTRSGHSRETYHTKRMQHVFCVRFTRDAKYVLSGSDDGNIRLWKARASEKLGPLDWREKRALEYADKLKERYGSVREVGRILKHRNLPKPVTKAAKTKRIMVDSRKSKEDNRRKHSKPGTVPHRAERQKVIVRVET